MISIKKRPQGNIYIDMFIDTALGLQDRNGLSQACGQKDCIYRIGTSVYVARTKNTRDVFGDLKIHLKQT